MVHLVQTIENGVVFPPAHRGFLGWVCGLLPLSRAQALAEDEQQGLAQLRLGVEERGEVPGRDRTVVSSVFATTVADRGRPSISEISPK